MKSLIRAAGPRDVSTAEVLIHIGSLKRQYQNHRLIAENKMLSDHVRAVAHGQMLRVHEMLKGWQEVRKDLVKKLY